MDYATADAKLQGRCYRSRKVGNNTYLQRDRYNDGAIELRLHSTSIITWHQDGGFEVYSGGWNTVTTRSRMNEFLPDGWSVGSERDVMLLYRRSTTPTRVDPPSEWEPDGYSYYPWECVAVIANEVKIGADGSLPANAAESIAEVKEAWKEEDAERRKLTYWLKQARERRGNPPRTLTVATIMAEENVSVRLAKMNCYGLDRFLLDVGAAVVDAQAGYELISMEVDRWQHVRALKMRCPSTSAVYVSPVPPHVSRVPEALDWYFDTTDYLGQVSQQT